MILVRLAWLAVAASALAACAKVSEGVAAQPCTEQRPVAANSSPIKGAISVALLRLAPGCDTVLVSSAIPLPPGALRPGEVGRVQLFVNGVEQPRYVEPLPSVHRDGSLRSVLVQIKYPLNSGVSLPGQLVLARQSAARNAPKSDGDRGSPAAVILPTDPNYLVSTLLVGPTITAESSAIISPTHAKYEADFPPAADRLWTEHGAAWEEDYYDRAHIYYAWWVRTGNPVYWKRGTAMALSYRRDYLEASHYGPSAHWLEIEGVVDHYLLTGDESSRVAVGRSAAVFTVPYYMNNLADLSAEMDNRMQARTLEAFLAAWRINAPGPNGEVWSTLLPRALTAILASQEPSGSYGFKRVGNQCGHNKPFMVGILNDVLIDYYTLFRADPRVPVAIRKSVDYMWTRDWVPAKESFMYLDGPCGGRVEEQNPAPDLNNMIVNGFAWVYQQTRDTTYRSRADRVFAGGVKQAWVAGSKQFNQEYSSSFHYLAYRR